MKPAVGTFGTRLRALRVEAGLSMNALARLAGIDPAYVHRMEYGQHTPGRGVLLGLAQALELTPREKDRLLFAAGQAPVTDWQTRAEDYARRLAGIYGCLEDLALPDAVEPRPFVRRAAG